LEGKTIGSNKRKNLNTRAHDLKKTRVLAKVQGRVPKGFNLLQMNLKVIGHLAKHL
jgi:hypothetical protein